MLFTFNSLANNNLDFLYKQGFEFSKQGKNKKAFLIMQQLAKQDYKVAKHNLALSYKHGLGVKKDLNQAFYWLKQAHLDGITDATVELASFYYHQGDIQKAQKLWLIGAKQNDEYAYFNLAALKIENNNKQQAIKYLKLAKKFNHPKAQQFLEQINKL